jgi:SH3-like domain-containing protein
LPTPTETPIPTATITPLPPEPTITLTNTLVPTATPTITTTPSPTPVYGLVDAGNLNGIIIRPEPGSLEIVTTLLNGNLVEILPEVVDKNGFLWLHIRAPDGQEGWVQSTLIVTATPRPG